MATRPVSEWFRLRDAEGNFSINYKKWHFDTKGKGQYCDEIETTVGNVEQAKKIVMALDFKSIAKVDKVRKTWTYKDYEVGIDSVKILGDFVEIDYIGKDENIDPDKVTKEMVGFLKKMGCGKITRNYVGYPFLILFPDEVTYEVQ